MVGTTARIRINVGCGATPTPSWINFDNSFTVRLASSRLLSTAAVRFLSSEQRRFLKAARASGVRWALANNLPLADRSVDVVYSSHMVEHLDRSQVTEFLAEARRVLRVGGILRLAVPDISRLASDYLATGDADTFVERTHLWRTRPRTLQAKLRAAFVGDRGHVWMYDGRSLSVLLERNGFVEAKVLSPGESTISDPGLLNLREREDESVYVEAISP